MSISEYCCLLSSKPQKLRGFQEKWLSLVRIIQAKYIDITTPYSQNLVVNELVLNLISLLYEGEDVIEDLHILYSIKPRVIEQFLPQLCKFAVQHHSQVFFKQFLLAKSSQDTAFAQLLYWELASMLENSAFCQRKLSRLLSKVQGVSSAWPIEATGGTSDNFYSGLEFVAKLTRISEQLLNIPLELRNSVLHSLLSEVETEALPNEKLRLLFRGHENRYLARIYREYSFTLNTRERVLYVLVLGTLPASIENSSVSEEDKEEVLEHQLIIRSLERVNLNSVTPEMLRKNLTSDIEVHIEHPEQRPSGCLAMFSASTAPKRPRFCLRSKPSGLFGSTSLEEIEDYVRQKDPEIKLLPLIIKTNDDVRQEQFASQLLSLCKNIFVSCNLSLWLQEFSVIPNSSSSGLIEAIHNSISIDRLKRAEDGELTLKSYFVNTFGPEDSERYRGSIRNFIESLAGYSLFCYLFQVKDRHNGNILIDSVGHIIHIDFGYMLANSPGSVSFESAPFKLNAEILEVMNGQDSWHFYEFKTLMVKGFLALRSQYYKIVKFVEICRKDSNLPCFSREGVVEALNSRFVLEKTRIQCKDFVLSLIEGACDNWTTRWYDKYQKLFIGIW